jgi:hypothetical protein
MARPIGSGTISFGLVVMRNKQYPAAVRPLRPEVRAERAIHDALLSHLVRRRPQ